MTEKVKVKHLTKIFGKQISQAKELMKQGKSKEEILAETGCTVGVNDASFSINEGEIFVVMGLSGSGKSTLIRMINRLINSTDGDVEIDDQSVMGLDKEGLRKLRQDKFGMVFQNFALFPHLTVLENAEYGLTLKK
ncbi:ATP-binding cassette domain-containing protein, partial [Ligilactobacillus pobuzihii]|uniref:ATP-binding cassette domain-containing protein n=1 Tax=Ligilactobacillus pobuzihii TaxID=449659 RepID=UPI0019D1FA6B